MLHTAHAGRLITSCLLLVLTSSTRVAASPVLDTVGATETPTPYSAGVLATGSEAAYFNPALLVGAETTISAGFTFVRQDLSVGVAPRPMGVDVSEDIFDAREQLGGGTTRRLGWRPLPTSQLRAGRNSVEHGGTQVLMTVGGVVQAVPRVLALSMHAVLPVDQLQSQRPFYPDEREQYFSNSPGFELLGDRQRNPTIVMAAGWKPLSWLRVGGGLSFATKATASNEAYMPDTGQHDTVYDNAGVDVKVKMVPHFGVAVEPLPRLLVTGTLHLPYRNETGGGNVLQLWGYEYSDGETAVIQPLVTHSGVVPLRVGAGASYGGRLGTKGRWRVGTTASFGRWSSYRDRHGESPLDAWRDTLSGTLGGVIDHGAHRIGFDWRVVPSPVPDQIGRTNYVDNTRIGWAGGWSMAFELGGVRMRAGVQAQVQRLVPRSVSKSDDARHAVVDEFPDSVNGKTGAPIASSWGLQTNNPGYPGFWSSGWITTLGASLGVTL